MLLKLAPSFGVVVLIRLVLVDFASLFRVLSLATFASSLVLFRGSFMMGRGMVRMDISGIRGSLGRFI
jgi:hypothetical protein